MGVKAFIGDFEDEHIRILVGDCHTPVRSLSRSQSAHLIPHRMPSLRKKVVLMEESRRRTRFEIQQFVETNSRSAKLGGCV